MDGMNLIMAIAAIMFVAGLIRSFFAQERPDQNETKPKEAKYLSDREIMAQMGIVGKDANEMMKLLRQQKLDEMKLQILAQNPTILGATVPDLEQDESQMKGRGDREPIVIKDPTDFIDLSDVRPKVTWDDVKQYVPEDQKPEYNRLPQTGQVIVRILPGAPEGMFGRKINPWFTTAQMHYMPGQTVPCNKVVTKDNTFKGHCPICDAYSETWRKAYNLHSGSSAHQELTTAARTIKPVQRYYVNVAEWDEATQTYGDPKVLSMSKSLFEKVRQQKDSLKEDEDVLSLFEGRDFKIVKTMNGPYPSFERSCFMGYKKPLVKEASTEELHKKIAKLHDLCRLHNYLIEEELVDLVRKWKKEQYSQSSVAYQMKRPYTHQQVFDRYMHHVEAWVRSNGIYDPKTGKRVPCDNEFMQEIEVHVHNWNARHHTEDYGKTTVEWRRKVITLAAQMRAAGKKMDWDYLPSLKAAVMLKAAMDGAVTEAHRMAIRNGSPCYRNPPLHRTEVVANRTKQVDEDFIKELTEI